MISPDSIKFGDNDLSYVSWGNCTPEGGLVGLTAPPAEWISHQTTDQAEPIGQRAWMAPVKMNIDPMVVGKTQHAKLDIRNAGTFAATRIRAKFVSTLLSPNQFGDVAEKFGTEQFTGEIAKVFPAKGMSSLDVEGSTEIDKEALSNIDSGKMVYYVFGAFEYSDGSRDDRRTWFCYEYDPASKALLLNKGFNGMN